MQWHHIACGLAAAPQMGTDLKGDLWDDEGDEA
jgi:hypothetical protein